MADQDEENLLREGLETAGVQRFVGSNPTPRTQIKPANFKEKVWKTIFELRKSDYKESTLETYLTRLMWLSKRVNLDDPEQFKEFLA